MFGIMWNWIMLCRKNQEKHGREKDRGEEKELVNDRLFLLQVHENQRHQTGLEGGDQETKRDVHRTVMQINVISGKNGERGANEEDQANLVEGFDVVLPCVIVMTMTMVMGSRGGGGCV
ncbi:MAG: hypothetical protein WCN98_10230 [Verrucomicrobiaceae bacterium]